jgi:hypothetical protein
MGDIINLNVVRERKQAKKYWEERIHYIHIAEIKPKTREDILADVRRHYAEYVRSCDKDTLF